MVQFPIYEKPERGNGKTDIPETTTLNILNKKKHVTWSIN